MFPILLDDEAIQMIHSIQDWKKNAVPMNLLNNYC